jgi:antitoxin component YwqK of YwqJK toxin-antitoxin module
MKQLVIIFLFLTTSAFGQDTIFFDSNWKESNKLHSKFYRIQKKENDKWLRIDYFSENNQIQMKGYYSSINPEIQIGYCEWFHSNGKLRHKGNYEDNNEVGEHLWYFDNGEIEALENYKLGKLDGAYKEYFKNGKISTETSFAGGLQNGYSKYYREDGSLHSEGIFKDGDKDGAWKFYDANGKLLGTTEFKTEYIFPEANLFMKLPNSKWSLSNKVEGKLTQYIFKRESVEDKKGREIIPAIMVYIEDASNYKQDIVLYSFGKQKTFIEKGIKIDKVTTWEGTDFKISIKNLVLYKCHYKEKEFDHILYMIHIITKENKGVQIYLDMTKDVADEYEPEFLKTINSLEEK